MRHRLTLVLGLVVMVVLLAPSANAANGGGTTAGTYDFHNEVLFRNSGNSEPAVAIAADGTVVWTSLSWFGFWTDVWKGPFGSTPQFQGTPDFNIEGAIGGGDADVDVSSTGTLHITTLMFVFNPTFNGLQLGVSAIRCPNADTSGNFSHCSAQLIDTNQADRQWVTSDGSTAYISYHDSGSSTLIHVQRSDDDGMTWHRVGDPIVGQDGITGMATFNNDQGPIVADPTTHAVYSIYAAGQAGIQKGTSADFNNIIVSRSTDKGLTWKPTIVYKAPLFTPLNNVFPALAVDPSTGVLYAAWSDSRTVSFSMSTDHGSSWSRAQQINIAPANTAVFPWLAARDGRVDLVYYGTNASSKDDPAAVWNVYLARSSDGRSFVQGAVSDAPNHVGVICTQGTGCASGTRNLLDLFEVAINPVNGKAAIAYTNDNLGYTYTRADGSTNNLPIMEIAQER